MPLCSGAVYGLARGILDTFLLAQPNPLPSPHFSAPICHISATAARRSQASAGQGKLHPSSLTGAADQQWPLCPFWGVLGQIEPTLMLKLEEQPRYFHANCVPETCSTWDHLVGEQTQCKCVRGGCFGRKTSFFFHFLSWLATAIKSRHLQGDQENKSSLFHASVPGGSVDLAQYRFGGHQRGYPERVLLCACVCLALLIFVWSSLALQPTDPRGLHGRMQDLVPQPTAPAPASFSPSGTVCS